MKLTLTRTIRSIVCFALLSVANCQFSTGLAQGTAFTYQGRLNDGGTPAHGTYDLRFTIYDAASGGSLVGGPVGAAPIGLTNGLFTASLDFGPQVFNGGARWLNVEVRTNGVGNFSALSPRQPLTSAPYALYSANAGVAATAATVSSVAAGNIAGTLGLAQLPATVVTNGQAGVTLGGTFSGSGGGLSNLNFAAFAGGQAVGESPAGLYLLSSNALPVSARIWDSRCGSGPQPGWSYGPRPGQFSPTSWPFCWAQPAAH